MGTDVLPERKTFPGSVFTGSQAVWYTVGTHEYLLSEGMKKTVHITHSENKMAECAFQRDWLFCKKYHVAQYILMGCQIISYFQVQV